VEIDRHGRVSQLHALNTNDPALPTVTISPTRAATLATRAESGCDKATPTVLMALQTQSKTWTPAYRVMLTCGTNEGLVIVDAHQGTILDHVLFPAQGAPTDAADADAGAP
jgi:hypothetical protein